MTSSISNDQSQYQEDEARYEKEISDENDRHHGTMIAGNIHSKKRFRRSSSSEDDAEFIKAYNRKVASTQKAQSRSLLRSRKSTPPSDSSSFDLEDKVKDHLSKKRSWSKGLTNDDVRRGEGTPSRAGKKLNIRGPACYESFKTVNRTQVLGESSQDDEDDFRRGDSVMDKKSEALSNKPKKQKETEKQPFTLKGSHSRKSSFRRASSSSDADVPNRSRRAQGHQPLQGDRSLTITTKNKLKSGGGDISKSPKRRQEPSEEGAKREDILPQVDL